MLGSFLTTNLRLAFFKPCTWKLRPPGARLSGLWTLPCRQCLATRQAGRGSWRCLKNLLMAFGTSSTPSKFARPASKPTHLKRIREGLIYFEF